MTADLSALLAAARSGIRDPQGIHHYRCSSHEGRPCDCYYRRSAPAHEAIDALAVLAQACLDAETALKLAYPYMKDALEQGGMTPEIETLIRDDIVAVSNVMKVLRAATGNSAGDDT